jgi:hypothetical protein
MTEDLEEIKERLEKLEGYVDLLESRVEWQERMMKLYDAGIKPASSSHVEDAARPTAQDPLGTKHEAELHGVDNLLRSIPSKQSMHNRELTKAVRGQEGLPVMLGEDRCQG